MKNKKVKCSFCNINLVAFRPLIPQMYDGVHKEVGVCEACYYDNNCQVLYCIECRDVYKPTNTWWQATGQHAMAVIPCKKHSADPVIPSYRCSMCPKQGPAYTFKLSSRGKVYCPSHFGWLVACSAGYCQTLIHPTEPGVETSPGGQKSYCEDCAIVKKSPMGAPIDYHPLTWGYRSYCNCPGCAGQSGKADKWPVHPENLVNDESCSECQRVINEAGLYELSDGTKICHFCEVRYLQECEKCLKMWLSNQFHHSSVMAGTDICDLCQSDAGLWYCDVACESWWLSDESCECGGIHPYNYSPSPIFQWGQRQKTNPDEIPFLGLEIEVEAQGGTATRIKGAKIVRELASSYTYVVHDGTLLGTKADSTGGDLAFEIVTHPFTFEWFEESWDAIQNLLETLSAGGYRSWSGGRCGIHVHINRRPMTDAHQMKFINFIYGSTNLAMCIGQRRYRDTQLQKFSPFDGEDRARFMEKIRGFTNPRVTGHYCALNTDKRATLEARWFRGTLKPDGVRKNVEFIHAVWYFTKLFGHSSANEMNFIGWLRDIPQKRRYAVLLDFIEREYITRR